MLNIVIEAYIKKPIILFLRNTSLTLDRICPKLVKVAPWSVKFVFTPWISYQEKSLSIFEFELINYYI